MQQGLPRRAGRRTDPRPGRALTVTRIAKLLTAAGRQRNTAARAEVIRAGLQAEQLTALPMIEAAYGVATSALVAVLITISEQLTGLEEQLHDRFSQHPDAEILRSLPGLGPLLSARVLAEFGDDPHRYADAKSRKNYAGTAPITRASGTKKVVLARVARNHRLADASYQWAFSSLQASPGARALYDRHRARGATHHQALRALANRWIGILHGCLRHHQPYDELKAWPAPASDSTDTIVTAAA